MDPSSNLIISPAKHFKGEITPPGDKSISHRAVILSSMGKGEARITHFLPGADCQATAAAFQQMGVEIEMVSPTELLVRSKGIEGLRAPKEVIDCGNSGTTMRLLTGVLAGQSFSAELTGDASLCKRPMKRVVEPLSQMGARITGPSNGDFPPLQIEGSPLKGMTHHLKVPSAQVKSALLLAGMNAEGKTTVVEPVQTRDHTERMLRYLEVKLETGNHSVAIEGGQEPVNRDIAVPGDISSAAFFITAASMFEGSHLKIRNVGLNPTRTALIKTLQIMGAQIEMIPYPETPDNFEPVGEIVVRGAKLKGIELSGEIIPNLIDEIPVLAVAAALADGTTRIKDAGELRVKESDRIKTITESLRRLGARVEEQPDGIVIEGGNAFKGGVQLPSYGDHRIAMAMAVAGLFCDTKIKVEDAACIQTSFPQFTSFLNQLVEYE